MLNEAGLMPGNKSGSGAGGAGNGYSSRRNSLDNVGLYGGLPGLDDSTGGGAASGDQRPGPARGNSAASRAGAQANGPGAMAGPNAAGAGDAVVPPRYRRRVAEYFQRIADETGGK